MKDLTHWTIKQLKYHARHGDEDARAELMRRLREQTTSDSDDKTNRGGAK